MSAAAEFIERKDIFIGGGFQASRARGTIEVRSSSTDTAIGRVPDASTADIDAAVAAARMAFDSGPFPRWSPKERGEAIGRLSTALKARAGALAAIISQETGCPSQQSMGVQVFAATMVLDVYARLAAEHSFVDERTGAFGSRVRVRRAPVGVCAGIIPWNVPLFIAAMKLGPALAAGDRKSVV